MYTYNHENYVDETIFSIMAQAYPAVELIIIDDGSKDSIWGVINALKDNYGFLVDYPNNISMLSHKLFEVYCMKLILIDLEHREKHNYRMKL